MDSNEVYKMRKTDTKRIKYEIVIEVKSEERVKSFSKCLEGWLEDGADMARNEGGIWHNIISVKER